MVTGTKIITPNEGVELPVMLHEQLGLKIVKNPSNGFVVATLHFTAEKAKRVPHWEKGARAGMVPAMFEREYNIQYDALFGQKVFPQIHDNPDKIIVKEFPTVLSSQICWGGFDFGLRNPTSFHVYTVFDNPDGKKCIHCIWEHYEPTENIESLVVTLKKCPYFEQIRWIAYDPKLDAKDQAGIRTTSVHEQLRKSGLRKMLAGDRTFEETFLVLMRGYWKDLDTQEATFKVWNRCPNMIQEIKDMIYVTMSERVLRTKDYREKMIDKKNHALDDLKYFLSRSPRINKPTNISSHAKQNEIWRRHMR